MSDSEKIVFKETASVILSLYTDCETDAETDIL